MTKVYSASYIVSEAVEYGIAEAVLLNKLRYLCSYSPREDGFCWRTKDELQNELGLSRYQQDRVVKHLEELGLIVTKNTYIRGTKTRCRHFKLLEKGRSDWLVSSESEKRVSSESEKRVSRQSNNKNNNTRIIKHNTTNVGTPSEEHGNSTINEMFQFWTNNVSPITANIQKNRFACNNLLKKYGKDDLCKYILLASKAKTEQYAPMIADFVDLQAKTDKLRTWALKKVSPQQTNNRVMSVEDL